MRTGSKIERSGGIVETIESWPAIVEARKEGFREGVPDKLAPFCSDILSLVGVSIEEANQEKGTVV